MTDLSVADKPKRVHSAECIGTSDEFSGPRAIFALAFSLVFWVLGFVLIVVPEPQVPARDLSLNDVLLAALFVALTILAIVVAMLTMPRCGGVRVEALRRAVVDMEHQGVPFATAIRSLLPKISGKPCCVAEAP